MTVQNLKIDFSEYEDKSLYEQAKSRVLYEYSNSPVFLELLQAYMSEIQELYDAIIQLQKRSTIYYGQGDDLDIIGRIVGKTRAYFDYDTSYWFAPDKVATAPDKAHAWCQNAVQAIISQMTDPIYRNALWAKALSNHVKFASIEELSEIIFALMEQNVAFTDATNCNVSLIIPSGMSLTDRATLQYNQTNNRYDNQFTIPYPATMKIASIIEN